MKKAISLVLAAALCAGVLAGCGQSQSSSAAGTSSGSQAAADGSKELNLFAWVGMFPDEVISDFEAETPTRPCCRSSARPRAATTIW